MGDLFKELGIDPNSTGREVANNFLEKWQGVGGGSAAFGEILDSKAWSQEEIDFLLKNESYFTEVDKAQIWNISNFSVLGVNITNENLGIYNYFKKEENVNNNNRKVFLLFAGAYLNQARMNPDLWTGEGQRDRNLELIKKIFFEYEAEGTIFVEVSASLKQFSFVNFKRTLSQKINEWLDTNPEISDLYSVKKADATRQIYNFSKPLGQLETYDVPRELKSFEIKGIVSEQVGQLTELGFLEEKVNYITYVINNTSEINDIRANEDLESTDIAKFSTSSWLGFVNTENENFIRQAYWKIAEPLFRENYAAAVSENVNGLKLENAKVNFRDTVNLYVNKQNRVMGQGDQSKGQIGYRFAQYVLNNIRSNALIQILKKFEKTSYRIDDDQLANTFKRAEEAAKNNEQITGKDTDAEELSAEDIKAKQKFLKQCLLMSRLKDMEKINLDYIALKEQGTIHESVPYKGRLYLIDEKDQNKDKSAIINKLLIPNISSIEPFVNITPAEHANLIPKIRLVKVYTENGELKEHEFKFPKHSDTTRVNNLFTTDFDRGADFGVKEFSFSFDGSTPATAKNDITATLKLYFQSFSDFIKDHPMNNGHRYVDLLILPSKKDGSANADKIGSGKTSPLQFDPSYYRIRADVGWEAESAPSHLRSAIKKINKTFYLNMIDHEIDIRDDGSIEISVSYRAYIETALKGTTLDALASREARDALEQIRDQYQTVLNSAACTLEQLTTIRAQFLQVEENLRKNAFQSIIRRLIKYGLLKHVTVDSSAAESFRRTGYIASPAVFTGLPVGTGDPQQELSNPNDFTLNKDTFRDVSLSNSNSDLLINYFFLADLLYVVLDCLYDPNDEAKSQNEAYIKGTENFKFLLSSFQYIDLFNNSSTESVNIGNIPISVELFNEWFTENVLKPERTSYPVMYFIRDITKYLVTDILLESCFKNDLDKRLQFKTNNFLGRRRGNDSRDPIGALLASQPEKMVLDVTKHYKSGELPLEADNNGVSTSVKDLYNYITVYAEAPRGRTDKIGNKAEDEMNGIMHYQLGRDRGILKKIKFSKSDMQYIREARFFRHGHDGLMQLSAVYKISMDMVGNTLYYPGMEVFIDPVGLIGAGADFDPRKQTSIANKMGFGGYHLITSVKSSIGPGKFTTSVEALFSYSGDGDPKSKIIGSKEEITVDAIDTESISEKPQSPNSKTYCEAIENKLYQQTAAIGYGFQQAYEPIDVTPSDTVKQEVASAIVRETEITNQEPFTPLLDPNQPDNFVEDN